MILFLFLQQGIKAQEYKVMTENFAPFGYLEKGKLTGLSVEIVSEILKDISSSDTIEVRPWARAYRETLNGPNRIVFSMARTKEREKLFKWVGPLVSDRVFFYKRREMKLDIKTIEDAKNVRGVLLTREFPEYKFLQSKGFKNLQLTVSPIQTFKMLMKKRGELVPIGELTVPNILKEAGIDSKFIERTNVMLFEVKLYIAFSKDINNSEIQKWQKALDELKASGKYKEIIKRYTIK